MVFEELPRRRRVAGLGVQGETMQQPHDSDGRYDGAIRAKLGETLRERYDLVEPLELRLLELLAQLDTGVRVHETAEPKLDADVPREPDEG